MPNAFTSPPTLPDGTNAEVGDRIAAAEWSAVAECHNWLAANLRHQTVGQGWPNNQCSDNTSVRKTACARWRLPTLPGVTAWRVRIYAGASGGATYPAEVRVTSANGAATLTLSPNTAADAWYTGTVATAVGSGYDTLTLDIQGWTDPGSLGGGAGTLTLLEIEFTPEAISSPLGTAKIGSVTPLGAGLCDADDPLPAWVAQTMRANLEAFRTDYPRCVVLWSALNGLTASSATPNTAMPAYLHEWLVLANQGAVAQGQATVKVHAYCNADAVSDESVRIARRGQAGDVAVVATGGGGLAWYTGTHEPTEDAPAPGLSMPFATHRLGIHPGSAADGRTDAEVRAVCAWME